MTHDNIAALFREFHQDLVVDALRIAAPGATLALLSTAEADEIAVRARAILAEMKITAQTLIDDAPAPILRLFREYDEFLVRQALTAVGINVDPSTLTDKQIADGAEQAEILIRAELARRLDRLLNGQ